MGDQRYDINFKHRNCVLPYVCESLARPYTRIITDLQDVVRTVNQVYAARMVAVIAAKSQPNLYV